MPNIDISRTQAIGDFRIKLQDTFDLTDYQCELLIKKRDELLECFECNESEEVQMLFQYTIDILELYLERTHHFIEYFKKLEDGINSF